MILGNTVCIKRTIIKLLLVYVGSFMLYTKRRIWAEVFMDKFDLQGMDIEEITNLLKQLQEPEYRARQLFQWIHQKTAISFAEMTNIPKSLKAKLAFACI